MGRAIARLLHRNQVGFVVFNRTPVVAHTLGDVQLAFTESLAELASLASLILICVRDDEAVDDVLFRPNGLADCASSETLIADMSTVHPERSKMRAERLAHMRIEFVDAPIAAGTSATENGRGVLLVGGSQTNYQRLKRALALYFTRILHLGPVGMGHYAKLAFNLLLASRILSLSEFLTFGASVGLDLESLREIVMTSDLQDSFSAAKFDKIKTRRFEPGFCLELLSKDLDIVNSVISEQHMYLPIAELLAQILSQGSDDLKWLDYAGVIKHYEVANKLTVK